MTGSVLALNIFFTVLSDAACAVLIGCLLGIYWLKAVTAGASLETDASSAKNLRRVCLACVAGLIIGQIVRPWFAAASMSGSGGFAGNAALVPDILSSTHAGKVWYIGSTALAPLLAAVLIAGRRINALGAGLFTVSLVLTACAKAASGHAAGEGDFTLSEFSMLLHIGGTAVWAGTVVASGFIVLPDLARSKGPLALWSYARLLSRTVTWALLAILVSGIYTSERELSGSLSGLWSSGWGRILMTKIAFVSLALALGAIARFKCVKRPATGERAELMVRLLRAEAFAMIVILCLSGLLANTPPAMREALITRPDPSNWTRGQFDPVFRYRSSHNLTSCVNMPHRGRGQRMLCCLRHGTAVRPALPVRLRSGACIEAPRGRMCVPGARGKAPGPLCSAGNREEIAKKEKLHMRSRRSAEAG